MAENHDDFSKSKDKAPIANAEDLRKQWEARGYLGPSSPEWILEIGGDAAGMGSGLEIIKEMERSVAFAPFLDLKVENASIQEYAKSIADCLPSPEALFSSMALQALIPMAPEGEAHIREQLKMAIKAHEECLSFEESAKSFGAGASGIAMMQAAREIALLGGLDSSKIILDMTSQSTLAWSVLEVSRNLSPTKALPTKPCSITSTAHPTQAYKPPNDSAVGEKLKPLAATNAPVASQKPEPIQSTSQRSTQELMIVTSQERERLLRMDVEGNRAEAIRFIRKRSREMERACKRGLGFHHGRPSKPESQTRAHEVGIQVESLLPEFTGGMSLKKDLEAKYKNHRSTRRKIEAELLSLIGDSDKVEALMLFHKPLTATCRYVSGLPGICLSTETVQN